MIIDINRLKLKLYGCKHCNVNWNYDDEEKWNNASIGDVRIGQGEMLCNVGNNHWHITEISYCPFCGRKLN